MPNKIWAVLVITEILVGGFGIVKINFGNTETAQIFLHIYHFFRSLVLLASDFTLRSFFRQHFRPSLWPLSAAVPAPSGRAPRAPPSQAPTRSTLELCRSHLPPTLRAPSFPSDASQPHRAAPPSLPTPLSCSPQCLSPSRLLSAADSLRSPPFELRVPSP